MTPTKIYTPKGKSFNLGKQIGQGGEGTVYEIEGNEKFVCKVPHQPYTKEQLSKLKTLVHLRSERLGEISAWPANLLYDRAGGAITGFAMKRVTGKPIHLLYTPKSRLKEFPEVDWRFLLHVAGNIARAVNVMHEHGIVIGDLNHGNLMVAPNGTVQLIDCDSFQVTDSIDTYRCNVGIDAYTPPELQGCDFRSIVRLPQHDLFGLGVLIFQMLYLGRHPFAGRYIEGQPEIGEAIRQMRYAYGRNPEQHKVLLPPGALSAYAVTPALEGLFADALLGTDHERSTAKNWVSGIEALEKLLMTCQTSAGHYYPVGLDKCPWCKIEAQSNLKMFPSVKPATFLKPKLRSHLHLRYDGLYLTTKVVEEVRKFIRFYPEGRLIKLECEHQIAEASKLVKKGLVSENECDYVEAMEDNFPVVKFTTQKDNESFIGYIKEYKIELFATKRDSPSHAPPETYVFQKIKEWAV